MSRKAILIVAGGTGKRMQSSTPKQFLIIKNKPVLMHTIEAFHNYDQEIPIYLTLPAEFFEYWKTLQKDLQFSIEHTVVEGGETRFQSVKNGINAIDHCDLIAIHDGVRPMVTSEMIHRSFQTAEKYGSAIASIALKDSIRQISNQESKSVNRDSYRLIQTPQTFLMENIKISYQTKESNLFTDDASVYENHFGEVALYEGDSKNIKITTPEDLLIVETFLSHRAQ